MFSRPFLLQSRNFEPRLRPVGNSAQQIEAQVSTAEWNWALIFMFYSPEAARLSSDKSPHARGFPIIALRAAVRRS